VKNGRGVSNPQGVINQPFDSFQSHQNEERTPAIPFFYGDGWGRTDSGLLPGRRPRHNLSIFLIGRIYEEVLPLGTRGAGHLQPGVFSDGQLLVGPRSHSEKVSRTI